MAQTVRWRMTFDGLAREAKSWLSRQGIPVRAKNPKGYKGPDGTVIKPFDRRRKLRKKSAS